MYVDVDVDVDVYAAAKPRADDVAVNDAEAAAAAGTEGDELYLKVIALGV